MSRRSPVGLLDKVRQCIRLKGYSIRTEKSYAQWIKRFILFHGKRHPRDMGKMEIEETNRLISFMNATNRLMADIMYGSGLRVIEWVRLRVKDVDLAMHQIVVRDGKGKKDRITVLPQIIRQPLHSHLSYVRRLH